MESGLDAIKSIVKQSWDHFPNQQFINIHDRQSKLYTPPPKLLLIAMLLNPAPKDLIDPNQTDLSTLCKHASKHSEDFIWSDVENVHQTDQIPKEYKIEDGYCMISAQRIEDTDVIESIDADSSRNILGTLERLLFLTYSLNNVMPETIQYQPFVVPKAVRSKLSKLVNNDLPARCYEYRVFVPCDILLDHSSEKVLVQYVFFIKQLMILDCRKVTKVLLKHLSSRNTQSWTQLSYLAIQSTLKK